MKHHLRNRILFFSFLILFVLIKNLLASNNNGPFVFDDELIYRMNAENIFHLELLSSTHYPPLYPLLLSLAFFSKEHWYNWMLYINVLLSSLVIIPIWLISIRFMPKSLSFTVIILMCLSSFHLYYPRLIMSENMYVPLFLFSIVLLLNTTKKNKKLNLLFNALFGVSMALGYLTKYLHLVAIPFLIMLWWVKPFFDEDLSKRKIIEKSRLFDLLVIVSGLILSYVPWLIYLQYAEIHVTQGMGSQFIRSGIPDYATLKSLILWVSFYVSYFILSVAPYLLVLSIYLFMLLSGNIKNNRQETFFIIAVAVLSIIFLMTAIQHSWRASYNYPVPNRVMGRYLMHLSPLYLIVFMIALNKIKNAVHRLSLSQIIICSLFCFISIFIAIEMLFIIQDAKGLEYSFLNSPDGVMFENIIFTFLFLLIFVLVAGILIVGRRNKLLLKHFILLFSMLLLMMQLSTSYKALKVTFYSHTYQLHGRALSQFLGKEIKMSNEKIIIVNGNPKFCTEWLSPTIKFWLLSPIHNVSINFITIKDYFSDKSDWSDKMFFLTRVYYGIPLYKYAVNQQKYYIYDFKSLLQNHLLQGVEDFRVTP
jgi:hypothetical protein